VPRERELTSCVIPGWCEAPDLRCAIAHRGISRCRVHRGACHRAALRADPLATPRNDDRNGSLKSESNFAAARPPGVRRDDGKARAVAGRSIRSPILTIFWHCDSASFSFRIGLWACPGNEPSTVLAEDCAVSGSGNVVSRRKIWSSEGGGPGRSSLRCSGCVAAHPPDRRASAS
jgi:hypothetical protein